MTLDAFLLEILVCPETREKVEPADDDMVAKLNAAIDKGALRNRTGGAIDQKIDGALVRADGALAYVVRDDIPVMLVDEAVPLDQLAG
jgi:uncharacterized protein YbaR (Trm112 family)